MSLPCTLDKLNALSYNNVIKWNICFQKFGGLLSTPLRIRLPMKSKDFEYLGYIKCIHRLLTSCFAALCQRGNRYFFIILGVKFSLFLSEKPIPKTCEFSYKNYRFSYRMKVCLGYPTHYAASVAAGLLPREYVTGSLIRALLRPRHLRSTVKHLWASPGGQAGGIVRIFKNPLMGAFIINEPSKFTIFQHQRSLLLIDWYVSKDKS